MSQGPISDEAYAHFIQPGPEGGELVELQRLAERQLELEAEVARLDAQLVTTREELRSVSDFQVPELMDQIGMAEFRTTTGFVVSIKETIRASITKEKGPRAFKWLKANGHGSLIKRVVSVSFNAGEEQQAQDLHKQLQEGYEVTDNASVHAGTLSAWVKEKLQAGEEVPLELFGVHRQRVSKIGK